MWFLTLDAPKFLCVYECVLRKTHNLVVYFYTSMISFVVSSEGKAGVLMCVCLCACALRNVLWWYAF